MALLDAAIAFFIPYYTIVAAGQNSITDVYSVGKTVFIALLGAVTLEICVIARYWTLPFLIFVLLSYFLVYPFEIVFPAIEKGISYYDPGQWGVGQAVFKAPTFWFVQIVVCLTCFGHRYLERSIVWLFHPQVRPDSFCLEVSHRAVRFTHMHQCLHSLHASCAGTHLPVMLSNPAT